MPKGLKRIFILLILVVFSFSYLAAEEPGVDEASGAEVAIDAGSTEVVDDALAVEDDQASEEAEGSEESDEPNKKRAVVSFELGGMVKYDKNRLTSFYSDYFGWLNLPVRSLVAIPLPGGFTGGGVSITGLDINGQSSSLKFPIGGGVMVRRYNRGIDANYIEYAEGEFGEWWNEDFWSIQNQRKEQGKSYVEDQYDVAWAEWGFEWSQNVKFKKSPGSNLQFDFGYRGYFYKWLQDNNPNSQQLLFETALPDRQMSVLNKLIAKVAYSHTTAPKQRFTHGLYNSISTSFSFEVAPGVFNPNVYGNRVQKTDEKDNPLYWYLNSDGSIPIKKRTTDMAKSENLNDGVAVKMMEYEPTADYYVLDFAFGGSRALWDVAPDRQTNIFSGAISGGANIHWMSALGWDGYMPLVVRDGNPRFKTGAHFNFRMNLPDITIMDLKSWSTPRANVGFARVENKLFGFLNKFGLGISREQFNNMSFLDPWIDIGVNASYFRDFDGNFANFWAERDYMFTEDMREGFGANLYARLNIKIMGMFTAGIGFNMNFGNLDAAFIHSETFSL